MPAARSDSGAAVTLAIYDQGAVTVEHIGLAARQPGEIDVEISAAAICGSDLHTVSGHRSAPPRTVLGHEGVGRVLDVDDGVTDLRGTPLRPGDRAVFALFSACDACDRCARGLHMKCRSLLKYGHAGLSSPPHATGTLATRVRLLPGVPVLRIPEDVADEQVVSAGCAVATAAAIVNAAGEPAAGERVLVLGAGAVGAYTVAMLATLGCDVRVKDPSEKRLAAATAFGGKAADPEEPPFGVVVEASGSAAAFEEALGAADIGGRVVAAGTVSPGSLTVTFDPALLVTRRLEIVGVHNYTPDDFRWGVDWLLAHGRHLDLGRLRSPALPLESVEAGFQQMREGRYPRVLVRPGAGE